MRRLKTFWLAYAHRYRGWYLLGVLCLVATNVLTVAIPAFVQYAIDALDQGLGQEGALPWAFAILGAGLGVMGVRTLSRTLFFNPGRTVEFRIKSDLFSRLLRLPQSFFDRMTVGDLVSRGTNDTSGVRALVGFGSLQLFNVIFTLTLTLGRMTMLQLELTLLCAVPLFFAALVLRVAVRRMFRLHADLQAQLGVMSSRILESYSGASVLQAFNAGPGIMARFDTENLRLLSISEGLLKVRSWLMPIAGVAGNLCVVIVLYRGGELVMVEQLTKGELVAFVVYVNILVEGLMSLGFLFGVTQRGFIALGRVQEVIEAPSERAIPTADMPSPGGIGHGISVRNLTFTHPGAEAPTLHDLSFEIAPGETLGVFGLTGSGKSTLLNVLARVYDPPPGAVRLSGVDAGTVPIRAYWDAVGYVRQEAFLFSRPLRNNIALGEVEIDADRLDAAVADAALDTDIAGFAKGLDTVVGERGVTLSGGQRQRATLARAFYRDFDLLLLDDVMSAVDHATERRLIDAVYRRTEGGTAVVVSHRTSVLASADHIIVLDGGRVVEAGTHAALTAGDGVYARAWHLQRAVEALEVDTDD